MCAIYHFFEIIYFKLNSIKLKGQNEGNTAHFAAFTLSLFFDFNIITVFILLDRVKLVSFWLTNEYKIILLVGSTYLIVYLIFIVKDKYKMISIKFSNSTTAQKRRMDNYLILYIFFTFILFIVLAII